jgi:hypothetical protein
MAARLGTGLPEGSEVGGSAAGAVPVAHILDAEAVGDLGNAGGVGQYLADGDRRPAVGAKLRSVARDRRVVAELPPLGEQVDDGGGDPFGAGEDAEQGWITTGGGARERRAKCGATGK